LMKEIKEKKIIQVSHWFVFQQLLNIPISLSLSIHLTFYCSTKNISF
jgi:hypothetical protein